MSAPERRYTDSDVRSDPELTELAYDYLDGYTGEFDPLVRAQDRVRDRQFLTTAQIRVVLNCMRHDWDIADKMPEPMGKVIDMPVRDKVEMFGYMQRAPKKSKQRQGYLGPLECDRTDLHEPHPWNTPDTHENAYWRCAGLRNGRPEVLQIDAKITVPFVKAKQGRMVHLVGEGSYFNWYPNQYGDGWTWSADVNDWRHEAEYMPHLHVKTLCKHPSWIGKGPILMAEIPEGLITNDGAPIGLCKYCKTIRNAEFKNCGLGCKTLGTHTFNIECNPPEKERDDNNSGDA